MLSAILISIDLRKILKKSDSKHIDLVLLLVFMWKLMIFDDIALSTLT